MVQEIATPDSVSVPGPSGVPPRPRKKNKKRSFIFEVQEKASDSELKRDLDRTGYSINASVISHEDQESEECENSAFLKFDEQDGETLTPKKDAEIVDFEDGKLFTIVDSLTNEVIHLDLSIFDLSQGFYSQFLLLFKFALEIERNEDMCINYF